MHYKNSEYAVTVCCAVYNHAPYLRQTLQSFIDQETNFRYRVLVHDDASTDNSAEIIREFEREYPDIIYGIYQNENQYSKGKIATDDFIFPLVKEKYIAICEGDDYWCDRSKLQLQYDYMESHPDCALCVHDTEIIYLMEKPLHKYVNGLRTDCDYDIEYILNNGGIPQELFHTSSFFKRTSTALITPKEILLAKAGDLSAGLYASSISPIHYIGRVMSCYRFGVPTSWSKRTYSVKKNYISHIEKRIDFWHRFNKFTNYTHNHSIKKIIADDYLILIRTQKNYFQLLNPKTWPAIFRVLKNKIRRITS